MARSMIAGATSYSHQSLEDMVTDLTNWAIELEKVTTFTEKSIQAITKNGNWGAVVFDEQAIIYQSLSFFNMSLQELNEITPAIGEKVENHHVNRIRSVGQTPDKIARRLVEVWNRDLATVQRRKNADFAQLDDIYRQARSMADDMLDLINLAARLKDFVGKRGKIKAKPSSMPENFYVDPHRIDEMRKISASQWDLSKLIRLCEELNTANKTQSYFSVAMLSRTILDHVPPIFGCNSFPEVANNYGGGGRSFSKSMKHLENSLRNIGDAHLHVQISLPTRTQVNFSNDLDVLLAEVIRIVK
jgi:hypothetical protein